jgi:hypothetical protein
MVGGPYADLLILCGKLFAEHWGKELWQPSI